MEKAYSAETMRRQSTDTWGDQPTAVPTPARVDSLTQWDKTDIGKAIEDQEDLLPASIEIPDGGWKAWLTVVGAWCILFSTVGMTNAFGVYQDYYVRIFLPSYSPSAIGWIGSTQIFFQFSMGFLAGKAFDAGYFYHMVSCASILYLFAYYMLSLAHPDAFYQVFLSQGVAAGVALGFLFLPAISVIAHHFKRRRSVAMGIVLSGSACCGIVFPLVLNQLIVSRGFAQATRTVAYLCTGMMSLAILLMRTRLPPPFKAKDIRDDAPAVSQLTVKDIVKDACYMITVAGAFFNFLGLFLPWFYLQLYAIAHGVDENVAFYTVTMLNGAAVVGRILANFVGEMLGPFNAVLACTLACIILLFTMLSTTSPGGIIAICILYGLSSGACAYPQHPISYPALPESYRKPADIALIAPLCASLAGSISDIGLRVGFAFTIIGFAVLAGMPIAGALLTPALRWERPLCFSGACMSTGFVLLLTARRMAVKKRGTWRV